MKLIEKAKNNLENNPILRRVELIALLVLIVAAVAMSVTGICLIWRNAGDYTSAGDNVPMFRELTAEEEGYDEDSRVCPVTYVTTDGAYRCTVEYSYEEWNELPDGHMILGSCYRFASGNTVAFEHPAHEPAIRAEARNLFAEQTMPLFNAALAVGLLAISLFVVTFFAKQFTAYEKIWFLSIMCLACVFAIVWPEESANGVSGIWIMLLYLLDTFLNILCELLISKQSKWNFMVSVAVEIVEIVICIVLMYRFATMLTTLFFWLPIDILSFINWNRHRDRDEEEITRVRRLRGWQEVLVLAGIALWTFGVGFLLSGLDIVSDLFHGNELLANIVCYLDACASAVGIANGLFIFFRFREQWIAWYICAILEAVINILAGQYILLVLKLGYLTNTTYGYIKWSKYIKAHAAQEGAEAKKEFF